MEERKGVVTMKGNPVTLVGREMKVGDKLPDFFVVDNALGRVTSSDLQGKAYIISAVPSLDTPVCDLETKRFNAEAQKLGGDLEVLTISMDLPFAQARWCGASGVTAVRTLSDYQDASFGKAFGVLIKELHLLARTIFVVNKAGEITYVQQVPEVTHEPDYDEVIEAAKKVL